MATHKFVCLFLILLAHSVALRAADSSSSEEDIEPQEATTEVPFKDPKGSSLASCEVFDPFKVLPTENGHFQIGGAFPLHGRDCLTLIPSSVQDVVAIQWALAHWNEQPPKNEKEAETTKITATNRRPKLGLFAGDSCSRPKEAISQTLRFVDSVGYHEPSECVPSKQTIGQRNAQETPKLIGVLMPKDRESAESVAQVVRPGTAPLSAFSAASAQTLVDHGVRRFVTTAPLFADYARTLIELIKLMGSDLVSIVDYGEDYAYTPILQDLLRNERISVAEIVAFDHPALPATLAASDSSLIVSLVPHRLLRIARLGELDTLRAMSKLWLSVELEMDGGLSDEEQHQQAQEQMDFLPNDERRAAMLQTTKLQFVTIRRRQRPLNEFSAYFLRVLLSNHAHYSLLRAYVQQVYGCDEVAIRGKNCSAELLKPERLAKLHRPSNTAEAAVLLTYAFARAAEKIQLNRELAQKCAQSSSAECHDVIRATILSLSPRDRVAENSKGVRLPPGFADRLAEMRFWETPEGAIQLAGIQIEAVLAEKEGRAEGSTYRLLEYRTGPNPTITDGQEQSRDIGRIENFALPQKLRQLKSRCRPYRSYCGSRCDLATRRPDGQTFLSVPQQYSLFIAAMFNLRGPHCTGGAQHTAPSARDGVALPLAFVHAMSSFRRRQTPQSGLFNNAGGGAMDIGALLVDTCGNGRDLTQFLVDSERNCYRFGQAERNWTIAAGATIGYLAGGDTPGQDGVLQAMFGQTNTSPVIRIGGGQFENDGQSNDAKSPIFGQGPSHRVTAVALAQFLRRMHWQFVNVVLDRSDPASLALFKEFERIAPQAAICTAELVIVGQEKMEEENGHEGGGETEEKKRNEKRSSKGQKTTEDEQRRRFTGVEPARANVTLVFATAKQAADYMSDRLRDELLGASTGAIPAVHVMLGDAHNLHLHDPANLAQFAGTLSFQAKDVTSPEFVDWLQTVTPLSLPEAWFWRHVEATWHCSLFRDSLSRFNGRMCTGEERMDLKNMGRLTNAGYLARGVDRMLRAIDKAHKKLCPSDEKLCDEFLRKGRKLTREFMAKSAKEDTTEAFEIYEMVPTDHHGNFGYTLLANMTLARKGSDENIGQNNGGQIQFENEYRPFAYGVPISSSATVMSRCRPPLCKCSAATLGRELLNEDEASELFGRSSYIRREPARMGMELEDEAAFLMGDSAADDPEVRVLGADAVLDADVDWAIRLILLGLSALLSAIALGTLLIILVKIWRRTICGSQSLGILLLLGIIAMHASAFLFTAEQANDPVICHLRIALPALAHVLCFGVIIVKAIQLRNAESLAAAGQQISYWNYWLLLFFIVTVQVVICFRWLLLDLLWPSNSPSSLILLRCSHSSSIFLIAQVYTFFLLFLALLLSSQNRNIKRNYKEAKWLFITTLVCILILSAWAASHTLVSARQMDYLTVLELHLTGAILLAFVFGPKLYVLLFYEPVVIQYTGADGCQGAKGMDLFEAAEWAPERERNMSNSPTLSCGSSSNGRGRINRNVTISRLNSANSSTSTTRGGHTEDEEKVTSAFQTVMRKKTSIGSKVHVKRTLSGSGRIDGTEKPKLADQN